MLLRGSLNFVKIRRVVSGACLAGGLWFVGTLCLILVAGGEWNRGITVNHPKKRMAAAAGLLAAWYLAQPAGNEPGSRERARRIGRLALLGLGLAAAGLAGEAALRRVLASRQPDGSLDQLAQLQAGRDLRLRSFHPLAAIVQLSGNTKRVYELRPNLNTVFGHTTLRTNADGLRADRDYAARKPAGITRIIGLGDSGMFGWSVDQDCPYLTVLERRLNAGGARYEVLNLAVPGYNAGQSLATLTHKALGYSPDIVVLGWCDNDVDPPFFLLRPVSFREWDFSFLYLLLFNRRAFTSRVSQPEVLRGAEIDRSLVDPVLLEYTGVAGARSALHEYKRLSVEHGFRLLLFGAMRGDICAICDDLKIDYVNLRSHIPAGTYPPEYGVHFMHPRPDGHRVLAEELERVLRAKNWI